MKIGIITFHCSYNYGSAMQAYALVERLRQFGQSPSIIDYIYKPDFRQYYLFRTWMYTKRPQAFFVDAVYLKQNMKRKKKYQIFAKKYFNLTQTKYFDGDNLSELNNQFDAFICGSDQIWNFDCTKGTVKDYFLDFASLDKLKISYAPSCGQTSFESKNIENLTERLTYLDYISVREKSILCFLEPYLNGKEAVQVLDPTLLLGVQDYEKILTPPPEKERYVYFYGLGNQKAYGEAAKYAANLAEKMGIKLYYATRKNIKDMEGENVFSDGPSEFLGWVKEAEYIVTNSFHATVFSVLFHKKFMTFARTATSSRMSDLFEDIGISGRLYTGDQRIEEEINYDVIDEKLELLRNKSDLFLKNALRI